MKNKEIADEKSSVEEAESDIFGEVLLISWGHKGSVNVCSGVGVVTI